MTRKHFELVATIVKNINSEDDRVEAACKFANAFQSENPRFDAQRFFAACNVPQWADRPHR